MTTPTNRSHRLLALGLLVVALAVLAAPAAAEPQMTFDVYSRDFDIGSPVIVNITGSPGMDVSIRITDSDGIIISGRDASLDPSGNYSFQWVPSQEGSYNITVTWSTGFVLTKSVLIQDKVTSREIGELYLALSRIQRELLAQIEETRKWANIATAASAVAVLVTALAFNYVRHAMPRPKTEFERFLEEDVRTRIREKGKV